jgi:hypothetical protein
VLAFCQHPSVASQELAVFFNTPGAPIMVSSTYTVRRPFNLDLVVATVERDALPAAGSPLTQMQEKVAAETGVPVVGAGGGAGAGAGSGAALRGGGGGAADVVMG